MISVIAVQTKDKVGLIATDGVNEVRYELTPTQVGAFESLTKFVEFMQAPPRVDVAGA